MAGGGNLSNKFKTVRLLKAGASAGVCFLQPLKSLNRL